MTWCTVYMMYILCFLVHEFTVQATNGKSVNLAQPVRFTTSFDHEFNNLSNKNCDLKMTSYLPLPRWKTPEPVCECGPVSVCLNGRSPFITASHTSSRAADFHLIRLSQGDKLLCGWKWALLLLDRLTLLVGGKKAITFENFIINGMYWWQKLNQESVILLLNMFLNRISSSP